MKHKYGVFTGTQISEAKTYIRKRIFFLLLIVDRNTKDNYPDVDVDEAFDGLLHEISGLNELLLCPKEIVRSLSLLQSALIEYHNPEFKFATYKKLVFGAGSEIGKIKEVDDAKP